MVTEPKLEQREALPYVAIRTQVTIPFGEVVPQLMGEVFGWLSKRGIAPAGAPFIRYLTTDMSRQLDLEIGVPVALAISGADGVSGGVFPAGRYARLVHTGPYVGLVEATAGLLAWAETNHIAWKKSTINEVEWWEARYEFYLTDPAQEPDPAKWETEILFLVAETPVLA